jgi:hypothetical protein
MAIKISESGKSTADILVPVAGAGVAFYYLYRQDKADLKKVAITTAIIAVGLYIVTTQITKRMLAAAQKPKDVTITPDVPGTVDNGSTNANTGAFDAAGWAKRLYDDISPFNWLQLGHDPQLYKDMVLLSNANLLAIYNEWTHTYYSQYDNRTLTKALKDESFPNMINGTNDTVKTIINRLESLQAV